MQWWNNFVDWLTSEDGWQILTTVVFPLLAIVVAGFIAAMIGRGSTKRLITLHDREQRVSTVAALIGAARRASKFNTLSVPEQEHADHLAHDADVSTRLLPLSGSSMTADWAAHEIAQMKRNSVSFSFQAEQSLMDFRDRLVAWQTKPSRAKKLFKADLDLWAYESAQEDKGLVEKQQEWAKQQIATEQVNTEPGPVTTAAPESKPVTWETSKSESQPGTGSASVESPSTNPSTESPPSVPTRAAAAAQSPAEPSVAQSPAEAPERPSYGVQATAASPSSPAAEPGASTDTGEHAQTHVPSPVSAQTVRQRVLPENYEEDELR